MEKETLNKFLVKRAGPLIDKINTDPEHPEQALTQREGIELLTITTLKEMVEKGELSISQKNGEFYFEPKGKANKAVV